MTVTKLIRKSVHNGNDTTTVFNIGFPFIEEDDITVTYTDADGANTDLVQGDAVGKYTILGASPTAQVKYPAPLDGGATPPLPTNCKLTIYRTTDKDQGTDLRNQDGHYLPSIESSLDKLTMLIQEQEEVLDRSIKIDITSTETTPTPSELLQAEIDAEASAAAAAVSAAAAAASAASVADNWKAPCLAATTGNISLSGEQTIDGVSCVAGDRVVVVNQTAAEENGIYLVASGAWSRAEDCDAAADFLQAVVWVRQGSLYADTEWVQTAEVTTVDTDTVTFILRGQSSSRIEVPVTGYTHGLTIGNPIKSSGVAGQYAKAQANSKANARVTGLVSSISGTTAFSYTTDGYISLTTAQWDALTGESGGLTAGKKYFLDPDTAGAYQNEDDLVLQKGDVSKPLFIALSTTDAKIIDEKASAVIEESQAALDRLLMAVKINNLDSFQLLLTLLNGFLDQYITNGGIDTTNSSNAYFQSGNKRITNDGIGGFFTKIYTGTGAELALTGVGFQPDFVWIKDRDNASNNHVYDVIRGATKIILTNATNTQQTDAQGLKSFDSDGFTVGTNADVNTNGANIVAWCFECPTQQSSWSGAGTNPTDEYINSNIGMSIVQFEGVAGSKTVNHNLGAVPHVIILKNIDAAENWFVYHQYEGSPPGTDAEDYGLLLNATNAQGATNVWDNTTPTSTTFSVGASILANTYIGYLFTEITGFSKFGTYEGNGTSQSITGLGFEPEMVMIKNIDFAEDWILSDNTRGDGKFLEPDTTASEGTDSQYITSLDADGFTVGNHNSTNKSGDTLIYMAFGAKGAATDIDLISEAQTADSEPDNVEVYALVEDVDSMTIGTDLKLYASRVTGAESQASNQTAYWTECTNIEFLCTVTGDIKLVRGSANISGQNSGTAMRYRFEGANTKKMYFHGVHMKWA